MSKEIFTHIRKPDGFEVKRYMRNEPTRADRWRTVASYRSEKCAMLHLRYLNNVKRKREESE